MEVKSGYKQTDVGLIPEDWDLVPVGDLFNFKNGLNKAKKFFGYGSPIVNYMDVFGNRALCKSKILGLVDVSFKEKGAYGVQRGDVFFTRTSETIEEVGATSVMLDDADGMVYSGFVLRARPIGRRLDDKFKVYCFSPPYFRRQVAERASYTTRALTNGRSLSATMLVCPPVSEQRAIASALSDMDLLLGGLNRLIAKKRGIKKTVMQQLLTGQIRLPGFSEKWELRRLGELGSTYGGLVGKSKKDFGSGAARYVPFVNVIMNVRVDCSTFDSVNINSGENQNRVLRGDLLFNGSSETPEEVALCSFMADEVENLYLNSFCFGFRIKSAESVDGLFFAYYMRSSIGRDLVKSLAQGSTRYNLSKKALMDNELLLPSKKEQSAIATILSDMEAEISGLENRRSKICALKQAMMQELLTGRTRLV
ncbi:restriction endonuclease subunit S [Xanthomonas arboricola]|uniref:restriction endonuclease subunit S n=1 Tax=Xanthomonas arboricola TaxID=56448 RepID=UPI000CEEA46D|nr:restriction endonuclease subunit S [Xanthomonas arboricola]PPU24569.1 hypothetical protein XarbCFBP7408_08125 [Xanthomonas arboricola pv. guizotiae]